MTNLQELLAEDDGTKPRLADVLLPKEGQTCGAYKQAIADFRAESPNIRAGKKTYERYKQCLLAAADIIAGGWEKLGMEDAIVQRKKSITRDEPAMERSVMRMVQSLVGVINEGLADEIKPQQSVENIARTALAKVYENPELVKDIKGADALFSGQGRKLVDKAISRLEHTMHPEMPTDSYNRASKQIEKMQKAISILKDELDQVPNDQGTRPIKREIEKLINNFANHAKSFLDTDRGRGYGR